MNIRYKISFSIIIFIFAILFILLLALNGTIATMAFTMPEGLYNAAPSNNTLISSAPWSGDGTYIGNNGEGLQFGTNAMQTRSITIGKGGTEGGSGDFDGTKARDFRSTGLSTFDISNTEIDALAGSNGASLVSNIKLNTVDDNYAAVAHALATTNFKVKISFTATVTNPTGNTISYDVFINFYPTGASGDKISGLNSTPVVANGSTDINDTNAITISTDYADLSNAILEIIVYIPENGRLKLSSPVTKVSLDLNSVNLSILSSSTIEVTGSNRSDRRIITGGDVVDLTTLYVKPGDHLTIITGAYINGKSDTRYKFPDKFPYIFNLQDLEGTEKFIGENLGTSYSYTDPSGIIYESSGIELTKVSEKYILYNELTSYQTEFIVGNNTMLSNYFTIRPKIPTGIDENGNHIYKYQKTQPYNIYIDSGTPGTPTISTSSAFGKAIQNGEWFTDNSQPLLEMTATGQTVVTDEYTFAFILPTYITSLDMTQFDFNELNTSFNNGASRVQVVASVETGEETVDIQRIFKYTKQSQSNFAERKALIFDRSGEYSLYLITVDDVGNYSITRTYSNVYVDSTYHDIGLTYSVGGAQIAQGKGSIRVYYIVGASEHDSNGNPIRDAKDIHAYSNLYNTAKGAKRGEFVTFMILMDRTAYTNYRLESYINYATDNVPITRPTLKSVNNDNERYLFMTYVMDEANVLEGCFVICSLLEKATINVSQTQFVYSGAPLNMNAYASVSTIAGQGQPTTILTGITATFKFYDLASATAKKTGNALTITLDGVDYPFDNVGALTPLVTYNLNDMSYYTVSAAEISTNQYDLKIVCLDESAVKQSVTNAGEYWYRAEITSQTGNPKYYASSENFLTINRASPNVIDLRAVELTYGDSLDIIQYTSKTSSGSLIDVNNGYIVFTDATTGAVLKQLYLTAANVYGEYIIRSIDFESDIYTNPGAGSMSFNVEFVPFNPQLKLDGSPLTTDEILEYCSKYSYYLSFYEGTTFTGGNGNHALNYASATYNITLVINKALTTVEINEPFELVYTGSAQTPEFTTSPEYLKVVESYELRNSNGIYTNTSAPIVAGDYRVTYYIDDANYKSEIMTATFTLAKQKITIMPNEDQLVPTVNNSITAPITDDQMTYNQYLSSKYGRLTTPNVIITEAVTGGITYSYSYKKMRTQDGSTIESEYSSPVTLLLANSLMDSGVYLLKIIVDATNYAGDCTIMVYLAPANANESLEAAYFTYAFPDVKSTYYVYNIGASSPVSISYDTTIGHLEYGQTIADVSKNNQIFSNFSTSGVQYAYLSGKTIVLGRFRISTEQEIAELNSITLDNRNGISILPVRYEQNNSGVVIPYNAYIIWEAGEYIEDVFVLNENFVSLKKSISLYVARATPVFDNINFDPLVYGSQLVSYHYGTPYTAGNNSDITGISQYNLQTYEYVLTPENPEYIAETGDNSVTYVFTPTENYNLRYREITFIASITVTQKKAEVIIAENIGSQFGDYYVDPEASTNPFGLKLKYEFFNDDAPITIGPDTPVGSYTVKVSINETNYYGDATATYTVSKALLVWNVQPLTVSGEIRYGVKIADIQLTTGGSLKTREGTYVLPGLFTCISIEGLDPNDYIPSGRHDVLVEYEPGMTVSNGFDERYEVGRLTVTIDILKNTPDIIIEDLNKTYNTKSQSATVKFSGLVSDYTIQYQISYVNKANGNIFDNGDSPIESGTYTLNVVINDLEYQGSATVDFIISKATTYITSRSYVFGYDGASHAFVFDSSVVGLNFILTYLSNSQVSTVVAPSMVGKYQVNIQLAEGNVEANYKIDGTGNYPLYIVPIVNGIKSEDLYQFYGNTFPITASFTYQSINPEIIYKNTKNIEYNDESFVNATADLYYLSFNISINGLEGTVIAGRQSDISNDFYSQVVIPELSSDPFYLYDTEVVQYVNTLFIAVNKSTVKIILDDSYETTYTGQDFNPNSLGIYTELQLYQPKLIFTYTLGDTSTEETTTVKNAGTYKLIIKVSDDNYTGEANSKLIINKADPMAREAPTLAGKYSYGDNPSLIEFKNDGWVIFNGQSISGTWSVATQNFDKETVGLHNDVLFKFVPDDKSLNEAYIYGTINISRKDISGDLAYEQADLEQEYNRDNHTVRAYILNKSAEYLAVDKNLQLTVSYNSASYAPVDCGAYKISIYVNSTYYEGSIGTNGSIVMNVVPATPSLILPTISAIKVGDELSTAKITGGLAYIGDTIHTVDGNFYFNNPKERPSVLNERPFSMLFAPTDFNNYTTPMFTVYVLVVPSEQSLYDYSYGTVSVAPFTYGIPLSSIKPSIVRDTEDIPGTIEWVDPMLLIKNGDTPEYRFIPSKTEQNSDNRYYYDVYPIITAKVDPVTINNATFKLSELSYGIVYVGERLSEVRLYFTPLNSETNSPIDDFSVSLMVGSSNISLDTVIDSTHLANPASLNVKITLSKNYYTTAIFDITDIRVRNLLAEINFNTSVKTKNYDGNPLSGLALLSTVGLSVTDTSFEQKLDKYVINSILLDGVLVDQVLSAGSYIVSVTYDDGVHYGNTTFTFEVLKRDISNAIKLPSGSNEISFEYGSSKDTFDLIFSEVIQEQQFNYNEDDILPYISFSYYDGNNGITYGPTSPKNAGVYTVTVSISISCPMFTGSRPFIYTITRKEINLYFPSASGYSFQYGEIISIIPVIDVTDAGDYYLTFNDSQITPENAGTYQVKAHLDGKNFYGTSSSVVLSIEKAKLLVTEYPTITGLIFGQNLGSATIVGGTCVNSRTGQVATGSFYFMDPTIIGFTAGTNNRVYLKYIYNDNYEVLENIEVDVTVGKATANITVTSQNAIYTAGEVRPIVNSDTAYPVVYEMYFTQGNVQVTPVNAGTYTVRITINDDNYQGEISNLTFTIVPVKAYKVIEPTPSTITYGSSLSYSAFFGGSAWYFESNPTSGSFVYASPALVPGTNELKEKGVGNVVGTYIVAYKFVPNDTLNYLEWTGDIIITVTKANASIFVSNYNFTYGDTITTPKFTTDPGGITVINSEFENASFEGSTPDAGVYNFRAYIDNEYYTGEAVYNIVVAKKAIEFKFVNENSNQVDKYITQYNVPLKAQILIDADSIFATGEGIASILDMLKYNVIYTYIQKDVSNPEVKFVSPTLVGTYYVSVSLSNNNYYIRAEDSTIDYEIERATITKIEFDANSISNQVYGSVSYPLVTIEPAGVPYELRFDDQPYLPTTVGDHNVVLIISDSNYVPISKQNRFRILPKPITIEDIKVLNKAFDGTSNLTITGTLKGLLQNDEVYLTITARTKDGATEVGRHDVEIVSWELKGQHAGNYTISVIPVYTSQITITKQTVDDSSGEGYITSSEGFSPNVTLVIKNVTSSADPSNIFTAILGQKAIVKSVALKENGNNMVLSERVKFYILLPENYRNSSDLEFIGTGALEGEMLNFVREGDYITFYADRSGEIVIIAHDFPYWLIIVGGALLLIVSLFVFIKVMPAKRRLYVTRRFRKEYQRRAYVTNVRAARAEKERLRLEEQKYNGHYD